MIVFATNDGRRPYDYDRYRTHGVEHRRGDRRPPGSGLPILRFALATLIILVWAAACIRVIFFDPTFSPPAIISAPALAAVTYLFGSGLIKYSRDNRREDE